MNRYRKGKIQKLNFDKTNVTIRETYIDDNGYVRDGQKNIKVTSFDSLDINKIKPIAEKIYNEIKTLNKDTEFTFQQFINKYKVDDTDKLSLVNLILDLCKKEDIIIVQKDSNKLSELPWNISRIKKN